jgi:hypothetical protein
MEQLTIFSNGGENRNQNFKTGMFNSDDKNIKFVEINVNEEKPKKNPVFIYQATDVDDDLLSMVNSDDFFKDNTETEEYFVCVDYLKKNKNDEYRKINISDIKHSGLNKHLPINKYFEINKKYGGAVNQEKVAKVMHEFKNGKLHSSSGDLVTDRKQAIAIALSEARIDKKENGGYIDVSIKDKNERIETPKTEIKDFDLKGFYKYMESELRYFLKDTLGVYLRSDGVFIYNKEMYYTRPYLKKSGDGKILKEAILSIQNKGREVGEIIFNPNIKDEKFIANSRIFGWNKYEFKTGGLLFGIPNDYKVLGVYEVVGKNLNEKIEIVGFEKENDTSYSFYQPLYGGANKKIGSLIVPNTKIRNVSNGKTVFVETSKGDKVKIKRLGSVNDGILLD